MEEPGKDARVPVPNVRPSSLRWRILRQALLRSRSPRSDEKVEAMMNKVSRKAKQGFNLIPCQLMDVAHHHHHRNQAEEDSDSCSNPIISCGLSDVCFRYSLPTETSPQLLLFQRRESCANINDFEICNKYDIDNTGLVCPWPSEEILSYYCLSHADMFRSKRIIELGAGYGLAGLVIATVSEASEVVISDGNPQVVDYIRQSISANSKAFGNTIVNPMLLHWNEEEFARLSHMFDFIVASDCTFFKEVHKGLVRTVNFLLKGSGPSEAIFFSPKRGDSLDKFLEEVEESGLHFSLSEKYDERIWKRHQELSKGDESWPNYDADHCYPLLLKISR